MMTNVVIVAWVPLTTYTNWPDGSTAIPVGAVDGLAPVDAGEPTGVKAPVKGLIVYCETVPSWALETYRKRPAGSTATPVGVLPAFWVPISVRPNDE